MHRCASQHSKTHAQPCLKLSAVDRDYERLKNGEETLIYEIKKRDYGFEIEDSKEASIAKVKLKDGKSSLRNSDDKTLYSTRDPIALPAITCLGFEAIESLELRAGLMTALTLNK